MSESESEREGEATKDPTFLKFDTLSCRNEFFATALSST